MLMDGFSKPVWFDEFDRNRQEEIVLLNSYNGAITQYLTPLSNDEAALNWNFDPLHKNNQEIIIRLTDDEANKIFHSDVFTGMIEDIRHTMTYPEAVIRITNKTDSQVIIQKNYTIDKTLTEEEFSKQLDKEFKEAVGTHVPLE